MAARSAPPRHRIAELARFGLEHAVHEARMGDEDLFDLGSSQHEAAQFGLGDDVGGWRLIEQEGDLAEEVAGHEAIQLDAIQVHGGASLDDDVQARSRDAPPQYDLARVEIGLLEPVGKGT